MRKSIMALGGLVALSACATTPTGPITAQERAECRRTAQRMGIQRRHDRREEGSAIARSPMIRRHDRCRAIAAADSREAGESR